MSNVIKRPGGRPSKLTADFIQAARTVLFSDKTTIIFTDAELLDAVNELLEPQAKITNRTFIEWKNKATDGEFDAIDTQGQEFLHLYKKALREQKQALMVAFSTDQQWQRWAWILERKFSEWNLKHISQVDHTTKGESLNKLSDADLDAQIQKLLGNK
ncbi:hypothetical protein K3G63_06710 [Hymenobacter sp. HSC-4F20]|uniref:hypothetical protein n=1 Tax=Hymenobacter sp. HSC-4F20 TaxID=2864135 RepID=UPI001C73AE18|nr:hypothetical protein [Hymenobacter sp. HSC-4F20]MBX0290122.1 hypothetical protein [Hymenobacter sp. HSC-4F20]